MIDLSRGIEFGEITAVRTEWNNLLLPFFCVRIPNSTSALKSRLPDKAQPFYDEVVQLRELAGKLTQKTVQGGVMQCRDETAGSLMMGALQMDSDGEVG